MAMRFVILLILCSLIAPIEGEAQVKKRYNRSGSKLDIRPGVRFGWQVSSFSGDEFLAEFNPDNILIYPPVSYNNYSSFHGGVYVDIRISEGFVFQPEVIYMQAGAEMTREADPSMPEENFIPNAASNPLSVVDVPIQRRLNFIQIPLIAKVSFTRAVNIQFGPQISFKMSESDVYGDISDSLVTFFNFTPPEAPARFQSLDYGAVLGIGYQMDNGLNVNLRYNRNFRNLNINEGLGITAEPPANYLSIVSLNVGFTFTYDQRLKYSRGRRY